MAVGTGSKMACAYQQLYPDITRVGRRRVIFFLFRRVYARRISVRVFDSAFHSKPAGAFDRASVTLDWKKGLRALHLALSRFPAVQLIYSETAGCFRGYLDYLCSRLGLIPLYREPVSPNQTKICSGASVSLCA